MEPVSKTNIPDDMNGVELKENERVDELQRNGYRIIQNPGSFCFGMDAVLLSAFARVPDGGRALDLCTGNGVIPILLSAKSRGAHFTGIEIMEESADLARRSVILNGLGEKVEIVQGDVVEADRIFEAASFDVITCNPPYMIGGHGLKNADEARAVARHEILCSLEDVVKSAAYLLKPEKSFFMVHRPFRIAEIISVMKEYRLEPKKLRFVHPYVDREPNMVLIEGIRGAKPRVTVEKPLIVFERQGVYTEEVARLYQE